MNPMNRLGAQKSSITQKQFRCCVAKCPTRSSNGFHNFPTDKKICLEWMKKTRKTNLDVNTISRSFHKVCKKHFVASDFQINVSGKKRLKKGAVPSLLLSEMVAESESNTEQDAMDADDFRQEVRIEREQECTEPPHGLHIQEEPLNKKLKDDNANTVFWKSPNLTGIGHDYNSARLIELEETIKKLKVEKSQLQIKFLRSQKKVKLLRRTIKTNKINDANVIKYLGQRFNDKQLEFFKMQLTNSGKKNRGQRYTMEQKSLALSLYKHGPKSYRFMQKIFSLPSKRTLQRHNAYLHFEAGIDDEMLHFIKEKVNDIPDIEKYCIVSWDEQSLKANLSYNHNNDDIDGFVDLGFMRRPTFVTHSLAFMVRGIHSGFKQSVAFFYTDDLKAFELTEIIRLVIEAVINTGLKVVGSVCDQVQTNVAAVELLINPNSNKPAKQEGLLLKYKILGTEIIHCYDLPHLLKVFRNNFHDKDLKHCISKRWNIKNSKSSDDDKTTYTASWNHVVDVFDTDVKGSQRSLKKITDEHINPNKLKMKVCVATQIFSQKFGNVTLQFSEQGLVAKESVDTAQVLLFLNDLFDSLNGSGEPQPDSLLGSINETSIHFVYWEYALRMLSKMTFIDKETQQNNNRSSVIFKFMSTVRGYIEITKMCLNLGMNEVALRNCNQDGLENLFGGVNSCSHVQKPIPPQFKTGYATMMANNLNSGTSLSANCEEDFAKPLLNNFHELLLHYKNKSKTDSEIPKNQSDLSNDIIIFDPEILKTDLLPVEEDAIIYISSVVCSKLVDKTNCNQCLNILETSSNLKAHSIITKLNPTDQVLYKQPSSTFMKTFKRLFNVSSQLIPDLCSENFLKFKIVNHLNNEEVDDVGCCEHKEVIIKRMKEYAAYYAITDFCKNINNLLSGKITCLPINSNNMLEIALKFREKGKHMGKHSDKFSEKKKSKTKALKIKTIKPKTFKTSRASNSKKFKI